MPAFLPTPARVRGLSPLFPSLQRAAGTDAERRQRLLDADRAAYERRVVAAFDDSAWREARRRRNQGRDEVSAERQADWSGLFDYLRAVLSAAPPPPRPTRRTTALTARTSRPR